MKWENNEVVEWRRRIDDTERNNEVSEQLEVLKVETREQEGD